MMMMMTMMMTMMMMKLQTVAEVLSMLYVGLRKVFVLE